MVPGERRSANTRRSSSQTAIVPFGERFGVPSGQTVAMKPSSASTIRRMSSVRMPTRPPWTLCRATSMPVGGFGRPVSGRSAASQRSVGGRSRPILEAQREPLALLRAA